MLLMNVKSLCLGILTFGEATGYEIKKAFETQFSQVFDAGFGSIYPALNQLTISGYVSCREEQQEKRPAKKVYSITENGLDYFLQELRKAPAKDKFRSETLTKLIFADMLPRENISNLIDQVIDDYNDYVVDLSDSCCEKQSQSEKFLCGFGITVRQAAIKYMQENRHLIESRTCSSSQQAAE